MLNYHKKLIIVLLALVTILTACQGLFGRPIEKEAPTPTPIPTPIVPEKPTYVVQRGKITKQLGFTGRISPVEERALYFKTSGYVKRVLVQRGDQVQAGDLLAELEIDDLLKQMAQAEVTLNSAQLRLDEAEKGLQRQIAQVKLDLAAAQARLTQAQNAHADAIAQAEIALAVAQEQLARLKAQQASYTADLVTARINVAQAEDALARAEIEYQKALDRHWEPQEVRDAYARSLQQAQWNLEMAQARYDQALAAQQTYTHDVRIQELAVTQTEANLAQLQSGVDPLLAIEVQRAQQQLDWLKEGVDPVLVNEVNQVQLALERLQAQVADAQIAAPVDGEVLSLSVYAGRPAEAFKPVIVVADPSAIEVSADLSSSQLQEMVEGQEAVVTLRAYPGQTWHGTVRRLPYPYGSGGGSEALVGEDKSTRISLEGDLSGLQLGDLARVTIVLQEKDDVLWLPPAAIRTFRGRRFVIVQEEDRQRSVDVTIGIESDDRVEILEGLEEGQIVVGQ
ncbi:MAG: HlyD family efflux transporter periplasmic adaptor subunit [Chloroflexi bacterium]|nr:HlyD family efflux transporter periplasmic adaptor subunit [Chloroflexota bacterium]